MKPFPLFRLVVACAACFTALRAAANSCTVGDPLRPVRPVEFQSLAGTATLIGFDEFTNPSSPPKKYRKKTTAGSVEWARYASNSCAVGSGQHGEIDMSYTGLDSSGNSVEIVAKFILTLQGGNSVRIQAVVTSAKLADGTPIACWLVRAGLQAGDGFDMTDPGGWPEGVVVNMSFGLKLFSNQPFAGTLANFRDIPQGGAYPLESHRDEWSRVETYTGAPGDPSVDEESVRYSQQYGVYPLASGGTANGTPSFASYAGLTDVDTQPTVRTSSGSEDCVEVVTGTEWRKAQGEVTETLTDEDTEANAEQRALAGATAGTNDTAYRLARTGSSFGFSKVRFKATFDIPCPGPRAFTVTYRVTPHGASTPATTRQVVIHKYFAKSGIQTVEGEIQPQTEDEDYKFIGIESDASCEALAPGSANFWTRSVHAHLSLGKAANGGSAGELKIESDSVDTTLYTPAGLAVAAVAGEVEVIRTSGGDLRQVKAPQVFADLAVLTTTSYEVRFHPLDDVGAKDPGTGLYAVSGTPYVIYKFENPDTGASNRLRITESRGSLARIHLFTQEAADTLSLSRGNGLRKETEVTSVSGADTTKVLTVRNPDDSIASVTSRTHRTFPWGEELISEILDPAGAALTTTYQFYDNATSDGDNYGRLKQRTNPDGSWERHTWHSSGKPLKTVRPFLNSAIGDPDSSSRVTDYTHGTLADADGDSLPEQITTVVETTLGTETGRSYEIEWSKPVTLGGEDFHRRTDVHCPVAGAAWNAATNLVTEMLLYGEGPFEGRVHRVVNPDGTATLTTCTIDGGGNQVVVTETGAPDGQFTEITDGTRTVTVTNPQGQTVSEYSTDIASALSLSSWTATEFDELGRPTRLDHSDGTYELRDFVCCGLGYTRDRTGAVTSFDYDDLGRQTHVSRHGITMQTDYDADGRVVKVTRIGTDSSLMVQETSDYDLAGRLEWRKDALNRQTSFAESFNGTTGETTRTTTNPDNGTVIEMTARDGARLSVSGTAAAPKSYEHGVESGQLFTKEILVGEAGALTEWTKTFTDFAGRYCKTTFPDSAIAESFYNDLGQLVRQVDPDGVTTLFAYNARGEQEVTAVDLNADNDIDFDGTDRITRTVSIVASKTEDAATYTVVRSTTSVWETDGQDTATSVSISEQSTDGLRSWQTVRGQTTKSVATPDGSGGRTVVTTAPDGTTTTQVFVGDLLQSATAAHPSLGQLSSVSYGHDVHHRLETATDARTGTTSYSYFADDQVYTATTPDPDTTQSGDGYDPQTTTFGYDPAGRQNSVIHPDGGVVTTEYFLTGQVKKVSGARTYPVEYTYDQQGRMKTLKTWQDHAGNSGIATTTWNYHAQRGWLENKRYQDDTGPSYTYKPSGRLLTRTWARGIVTTYGYSPAGELTSIDYSDATPDVTIVLDRLGRPKETSDGAGTRTLAYHASGQLEDEAYTTGLLAGQSVDRSFDGMHRLSGIAVPSVTPTTYAYDAASRLDTVTSGTNTAKYGYLANSPLVETVTFRNGTDVRLTTTKAFDSLNRLKSIINQPSADTAQAFHYRYNSANQRTRVTREDNAYWQYGYDPLGQVTSGKKYTGGAALMLGHDFGWTYDDIGNRKTATTNGQLETYAPNLLNQYDTRTVPGSIEVLGEAQPDATVTVTFPAPGGTIYPTTRQDGLFHRQLTIDNTQGAQFPSLTITGVRNDAGPNGEDAVTEETKTTLVPQTPEAFVHDADGNLTEDARWTYTWDAENRLIGMETRAPAADAGVAKQKIGYRYDGQSRRISKAVSAWTGSEWTLQDFVAFCYDRWNLVAEHDLLNGGTQLAAYTWGLDLSGTSDGVGGVGGLLFSYSETAPTSAAHIYDGHGNVSGKVNMSGGSASNQLEYSAYGAPQRATANGSTQSFGFSTKYTDRETGLLYFGFRYYSPEQGRWLSRDPLSEEAGPGIYGFCLNNPVSAVDVLGREAALDVVFFTVLQGGGEAATTVTTVGAGTAATAVTVSAALVVTPLDNLIGPPRHLLWDPRRVRPGGPGPINPEFRMPGRRYYPALQPPLNMAPAADLSARSLAIYFTPFGADSEAKCAPCLAIIGETFDPRVLAAKQLYPTAETFDVGPDMPSSFGPLASLNMNWIRRIIERGCTIVDIGYDSDRGPGKARPSGPFYELERFLTQGYGKKVYQQFPPTSYYRPNRAGAAQ